jgi:hypothetical protein
MQTRCLCVAMRCNLIKAIQTSVNCSEMMCGALIELFEAWEVTACWPQVSGYPDCEAHLLEALIRSHGRYSIPLNEDVALCE